MRKNSRGVLSNPCSSTKGARTLVSARNTAQPSYGCNLSPRCLQPSEADSLATNRLQDGDEPLTEFFDALRTMPRSKALDDHCNALPYTDTHRAERIATAGAVQLIQRGRCQPRATCSERMAEGDRTAVGIHMRRVIGQSKIARHGERLRRKCLVQFDHVHLRQLELRALERLATRR